MRSIAQVFMRSIAYCQAGSCVLFCKACLQA
jgi:hypothetical protein